jgi:hypothetical protein
MSFTIAVEAALCGRCPPIEKLRNGCEKLGWRERLGQEGTIRDTAKSPLVCVSASYIQDGEFRIDLSGVCGNFPATHPAPQTDVGHKRLVFAPISLQQGNGLFA